VSDLWECKTAKALRGSEPADLLTELFHSAEHNLDAMDFSIPKVDRVSLVVLGHGPPESPSKSVSLVKIVALARPGDPEKC
jgi:hypothetical protein